MLPIKDQISLIHMYEIYALEAEERLGETIF